MAADPGTHEELLARARAVWRGVDVPAKRFFERLERLGDVAHGEDVYLALGCELGLPAALAAFDEKLLSQVPAFLGKRGGADEVRQALRVRLLVAPKGGVPLIGTYTGRGALGGFVRVATLRMARDLARGNTVAPEEEGADVAATAPDPELAYLRRRHAADFKTAFQRVLAELSDEDRNVLALHIFDGLTTEAIGALYRVDGSTIRRRIQRMRQNILDETRKLLAERLGLKARELDSLFNVVRSELDLSIRRYLKKS
jgi:RNA polymerase sigma-70 factor, ECF subfamily